MKYLGQIDEQFDSVNKKYVDAAIDTHKHGYVNSDGTLISTSYIGNGDSIVIIDSSDGNKIANTYITFDAATTTKALTPKGTWETFSKFSGSYNDLTNKPTIPTVPTNISAFINDSGYLTSYTETDPVFVASAAYSITSSDILNWNSIVSDDKTWNGITLDKSLVAMNNNSCRLPFTWDNNGETSAKFIKANKVPTANNVALYDGDAYLKSTTPTSGDNSTKVATTAFVNSAVPTKTSDLTNDSGFLTSHQTIKTINNTSMTGSGNVSVQPTLVSGTNIKTINNTSLLGSGNIDVGGDSDIFFALYEETSFQDIQDAIGAEKTVILIDTVTYSASDIVKYLYLDWHLSSSNDSFTFMTSDNTYWLKISDTDEWESGFCEFWDLRFTDGIHNITFTPPLNISTNKTINVPNQSGTLALTSDIPTVPTINLNGSSTTSASFYAPTGAGTNGYVLQSNGNGAPSWVTATLTDTKVTVAENTKATKYYPILATDTGTATRQIDTDDQVDTNATAEGLWYQNGILCVPSLQVGDVDYAISTSEYDVLMDLIDAI